MYYPITDVLGLATEDNGPEPMLQLAKDLQKEMCHLSAQISVTLLYRCQGAVMQQHSDELNFMIERVMATGDPNILPDDKQRQWIADARADLFEQYCNDCLSAEPIDHSAYLCGLCRFASEQNWPNIPPSRYPRGYEA